MSTQLVEWQEKDFNSALKTKEIAIVEFGAPWCNACKMTEPIVAQLAKDFPEIRFAKIDVSANAGLASRMGVMSLPNILFLVDGKVKEQIIGAANRAKIEDRIKKLI